MRQTHESISSPSNWNTVGLLNLTNYCWISVGECVKESCRSSKSDHLGKSWSRFCDALISLKPQNSKTSPLLPLRATSQWKQPELSANRGAPIEMPHMGPSLCSILDSIWTVSVEIVVQETKRYFKLKFSVFVLALYFEPLQEFFLFFFLQLLFLSRPLWGVTWWHSVYMFMWILLLTTSAEEGWRSGEAEGETGGEVNLGFFSRKRLFLGEIVGGGPASPSPTSLLQRALAACLSDYSPSHTLCKLSSI